MTRMILAVAALLLTPFVAVAQTLTPTCALNADGTTKACTAAIDYDGTVSYKVDAQAVDPTTGDKAVVAGVILPLCQPLEITRPSGKLQIKWVCNKDLTVTYTLTKQ